MMVTEPPTIERARRRKAAAVDDLDECDHTGDAVHRENRVNRRPQVARRL
jgi:hypothetical protein